MQETSAQEVAIAEATIRVIVHQGFDQVSVRKVAQEAGIAPGTVQYHMGTRKQLLEQALNRSVARQNERVEALPLSQDPLEHMTRALLELLPTGETQREDAALWVVMGAAASTHGWLAEMYQKELTVFQQDIAQSISAWLHSKGEKTNPEEITRTARLITALVNGLTLDYLNATPSPQLTADIQADLTSGLRRIFGLR